MSNKAQLHKWVLEQDLRLREKAVLARFVAYVNLLTLEVWVLVARLAKDVGASERTVQLAIARLLDLGLIEFTGRRHKHRGGRWVPIYRIVMSDGSANLSPLAVQQLHPTTSGTFHPYKKEKEVEETSEEATFESEGFKTALSVYPRSINTKRVEAAKFWAEAVSAIEERLLLQAVWTYAGEWKKHDRTFQARGLQRWLADRDYELYLPNRSTVQVPSAGNIPNHLLRAFAQEVCPDLTSKYLKYANFDAETKELRPPSNHAADQLLRAGPRFFSGRGIIMLNADGSSRG